MAFKGKLSARNIRPMTRSFGQDIGGRVDLKIKADGSVFLPRVKADVKVDAFQHGALPKVDAAGRLTFQGGRLDLDGWNLESEKGDVSLKGWMHLQKKGIPWDLKINARKFEIGTLPSGSACIGTGWS